MKREIPNLDSVDSIYNYLRESTPPEVVSSTTPSTVKDSTRKTSQFKPNKKQKRGRRNSESDQ